MKYIYSVLLSLLLTSPTQAKNSIRITNPSNFERIDEPVVIKRTKLPMANSSTKVPVLKTEKGEIIPSQTDTLGNANTWTELAFVIDLEPNQSKVLKVEWVDVDNRPTYTRRTNIRFGKLNAATLNIEGKRTDTIGKTLFWQKNKTPYPYQMDGIAWENDKMGFRHYFDGRNSRDVFGKKVTDLVLDNVGIKPNGLPGDTYHVMAPWGRDIYSCANSFGLGGLGLWYNNKFVRLGILRSDTVNTIDQTVFKICAEGPVRSIFTIEYKGCQTPFGKINITHKTTIWAGSLGYQSVVTADKLPKNCSLITGIVSNFNNKPTIVQTFDNKKTAMITHDKQSYDKEFTMGLSLIMPKKQFIEAFDLKEISSWCVKLKPTANTYTFDVVATWEMQDAKMIERENFLRHISTKTTKMNYPLRISIE